MRISDWSSDVCSSDLRFLPTMLRKLVGKVGSIFTSSGTQHGGQESTILGSIPVLLHHGMIIVGLPYTAQGQMRSEEHPSELQSLMRISYAVFCLKTNINSPTDFQNSMIEYNY